MVTSIEREYKTMIHPKDYYRLKSIFEARKAETIVQKNYYFDTPSLYLKSISAALRLRVFKKSSEWTLKIAKKDATSIEVSHHLDNPIPVPKTIVESAIQNDEILNFLSDHHIDIKTLELTHSFETIRLIHSQDCCLWCLDMTNFPYTSDYELECEVAENISQQQWKHKLKEWAIDFHPAPTKIARASFYAQLFMLNFTIL